MLSRVNKHFCNPIQLNNKQLFNISATTTECFDCTTTSKFHNKIKSETFHHNKLVCEYCENSKNKSDIHVEFLVSA